MTQYIDDIRHASSTIIAGLTFEHDQLRDLQRELAAVETEIAHKVRRVNFLELNPELDDEGIGTSTFWDLHFDDGPKADALDKKIAELKKSINDRRFSSAVLAGGLLQIAKQGISLAHGALDQAPNGRMIGSLPLKTIVWQARNQAMHYEEGNPHPPVVAVFDTLVREHGNIFGSYRTEIKAAEVVGLLGWNSQAAFEADMLSLL
ncbi:MAG: hypothetical protein JNL04_02935 [Rhodospirillaceae bacterium]|nr:hypothetical protein [Rhodospirillaceae bacterium]